MRIAACLALAGCLCSASRLAAQPAVDPTAALLQDILRLDTSNPPGREGLIDELLASRLRPLGFAVTIIPTPEAGKSHLIARLKGDGSKRPVLIAAHADVVGVERDKWTVDPFGGLIRDDHVYGRGAIDFKGGIAVFARAVMQLAERKVPLARDVIFMAEADEEGAPFNTSWLARDHWDKIDYTNMARVNRTVVAGIWELANRAQPPAWNTSNEKTEKYREARAEGNKAVQ